MKQKSYDEKPTVYLVPTPIGNMDDMTIRSINILKEVEVIFSEDTRETIKLLKYFEINKKLIAAHEHNEDKVKLKMLDYLQKGHSVALVTDRGTPIISDPGYKCATYIIDNGYNVVGLPGPTALIPALIMSGLEPHPFLFYGFLNSKKSKRKKELIILKEYQFTIIFYETPHRIKESLEDMFNILGNRKISIIREISKKFEEVYRDNLEEIIKYLDTIKGEIVIVVEGNKEEHIIDIPINDHIKLLINDGISTNEAIKMVSKIHKTDKNEVYKNYHKGK